MKSKTSDADDTANRKAQEIQEKIAWEDEKEELLAKIKSAKQTKQQQKQNEEFLKKLEKGSKS